MKKILIVGGANGIGLAVAKVLTQRESTKKVYIVDKAPLKNEYQEPKIENFVFDVTNEDYSIFNQFNDIDGLIITVGFGQLSLFHDVDETMIPLYFNVNAVAVIRIIKHFYEKLCARDDFYCGVMGSIAGFMSSPFLAVYGSTKAALKIFIESINIELEEAGTTNRILNVSPGSIKGTSFNHGKTDLSLIEPLACQIVEQMEMKNDLFIPQYEEVFKNVLKRYHDDFREEGRHSYEYKLKSGRMK